MEVVYLRISEMRFELYYVAKFDLKVFFVDHSVHQQDFLVDFDGEKKNTKIFHITYILSSDLL